MLLRGNTEVFLSRCMDGFRCQYKTSQAVMRLRYGIEFPSVTLLHISEVFKDIAYLKVMKLEIWELQCYP